MLDFTEPVTHWNIFARELEKILAVRNLRLGHLDDRGVVLHREKVRRLQHSLESPKHLTTLNPEEMERLTKAMGLTEIEQKRLNASLLATAVEMTLIDRVDDYTALMAAEDVFNILLASMIAQPDTVMATGVRAGFLDGDNEQSDDETFLQGLDLFDRATLTLHLSRNASSAHSRSLRAHEAYELFVQALRLLRQCQDNGHEGWQYWCEEVQNGCQAAQELQ